MRAGFAIAGLLGVLAMTPSAVVREPAAQAVGGRALTEDGDPLTDADVWIRRGDRVVAHGTTDLEGGFVVPLELRGAVDVRLGKRFVTWNTRGRPMRRWVLSAERLEVKVGTTDQRIVVQRPGLRSPQVQVALTTPRGPLARAVIALWPPPLLPGPNNRVRTDEQGKATVGGRWTSHEGPLGLLVMPPASWCPVRVDRVPFDGSVVSLQLQEARTVTGRVVDASGAPVAAIGVLPVGDKDSPATPWGDLTGPNGEFRIGVPRTWTSFQLRVGPRDPLPASPCLLSVTATRVDRGAFGRVEVRLPPNARRLVARSPRYARPESEQAREARAVCDAVLRSAYVKEGIHRLVVLTRNGAMPGVFDGWSRMARGLSGVSESTLRDFERKNAGPVGAPSGLAAGVPVHLLNLSWIEHLAVGGGGTIWERVRERLRTYGGFLELSAVGFNEDDTEAVVRVGRAFGHLAGAGDEYLLKKRDGTWHIVERDLVWVS